MTVAEAYEAITYEGDSCVPRCGERDIHMLVAEVVSRLPASVQDWLLFKTHHVFIGGSGQSGQYFELRFRPELAEAEDGAIRVRFVFLSEQLMKMSLRDSTYTIAHEIAHSRTAKPGFVFGGYEAEVAADDLAKKWGFDIPKSRDKVLRTYPRLERQWRRTVRHFKPGSPKKKRIP